MADEGSMDDKDFLKQARKYSEPFCITNGKKFRLKDVDPGDTLDFESDEKPKAQDALAAQQFRSFAAVGANDLESASGILPSALSECFVPALPCAGGPP